MKYMVMTFGEAAEMFETQSKEWITGMIDVMHTFNAELRAAGELVDAQGLVDGRDAKTVRRVGGRSVITDGPFAEAKEVIGGYWIIQAKSKEEAVEWASRCPAGPGDTIEVRQVFEVDDFDMDVPELSQTPPEQTSA